MMPYCARNPPALYVAAAPSSKGVVLEYSSSVGPQIIIPRRQWRNSAQIMLLLMFFTMTSHVTGFESVLDRSAVESETERPTPSNEFTRSHECRTKRESTDLDAGMTRSMNPQTVQSVSSSKGRQVHQRRHGIGRRFTFSDGRRVLVSGACTNKDISIFQSPDGSSGIPHYTVQIMNNCMSDCAPSNIHVFCGWFASALLVNPNSFKRIAFDDCIVNGGKPLKHGETLRFTYANSFMYPLRFKSASFCK